MNQSTNSYLTHSQRSTTRNMKKPAADPCSTSAWNAEGIRSSFRMRKPFSKRSIVDCFAKRADSTFRINTENERSIFIDAHYRFPIAKLKSGTQTSPAKLHLPRDVRFNHRQRSCRLLFRASFQSLYRMYARSDKMIIPVQRFETLGI